MGSDSSTLMQASERTVVQVTSAEGVAPLVPDCEHASSFIPATLDELDLLLDMRYTQIAWDIGAYDRSVALCGLLDAPLVESCVSRFVYDCNRPFEHASPIPYKIEIFEVSGNRSLTVEQRHQRHNEVYLPLERMLPAQIAIQIDRLSNKAGCLEQGSESTVTAVVAVVAVVVEKRSVRQLTSISLGVMP